MAFTQLRTAEREAWRITLADGPTQAGRHALSLDGSALAAGVYVVRLTTAEGDAETQCLTVVY